MTKFVFIAVPLKRVEHSSTGFVCRELEIMSAQTIRQTFEATSTEDARHQFGRICSEIAATNTSWSAWCDTARGERAPRGFRAAKDSKQFEQDINAELATVKADAA